ncbi:hypothetical protein VPHK24_0006 [Vibrio phage K24]
MSKMKMSDVFKLPMVHGSIVLMSNDHRYVIEFDNSYSDIGDQIEHVAHAINNHDRMVEEIAELRKGLEIMIEQFESDHNCEYEYNIIRWNKDLLAKLNQEGEE